MILPHRDRRPLSTALLGLDVQLDTRNRGPSDARSPGIVTPSMTTGERRNSTSMVSHLTSFTAAPRVPGDVKSVDAKTSTLA